MNRQAIYDVIETERSYQDANWPRDLRRKEMYRHAAPHILLLEQYVAKARELWTGSKSNLDVVRQIAKIATIAVRALEEIEHPDTDLRVAGLRD